MYMANKNKKINELVSDDDPTEELEVLSFVQEDLADADVERETEANTYGFATREDAASAPGQSIPELQADLQTRTRTIGRLQFDIEQLRSKWLGLEKEISARAEIVTNLLRDVDKLNNKLTRKDSLLKKRNQTIKSLNQEIRKLEKNYRLLDEQSAGQRSGVADHVAVLDEAERELERLRSEVERAVEEELNLNSEINQRDQLYFLLEQQNAELELRLAEQLPIDAQNVAALEDANNELETLRSELMTARNQSTAEIVLTQRTTSAATKELETQRAKTEEYADSLRRKLQDLTDVQSQFSNDNDHLSRKLEQMTERNRDLSGALDSANKSIAELQETLLQRDSDYEQEIRLLRFELSEAQDTVAQTGEISSQLTSDLIETRASKEELERMLCTNEEQAQKRIQDLEKRLEKLSSEAEEYEQKLDTRSTAINVLLGELAKKSEQIESIGEIEEVIHEIDNRMSERFDNAGEGAVSEPFAARANSDRERITRVLVGRIGDQELRFPLFKDRVTIGRTEDNDIQLKASYISRRHAVILTEGDATRVIDWGSKNGVYVNSERVKEHFLSNADILSVGNAKFRYEERPKRDA